jgi:signal transduction histidine kinase
VKLDIPLIIVSGVIGEEIAVRAMREGAQDYVLKSNLARLPAAIERERREARSRARRHSAEAERERLLRVAQTANRMKDEFLATLSHELRTPLSVILGHLEFLQEEEGLSDSARDSIQTICRNAQLQLQLVNDLMDVSRIITGQLRLETTLIDTEKAMDESLKSLQLMSDAKRISITKTYASHGTLVRGDSARLQQVFWNLLSNAIKFTAAGGKIFVRIENENSFVKIEVQDTGVGIEPKFLPHVFDRFRQEDSSTTRAYGGLGLGLAIVRHIVELHGGTITAESAGKNQGALFRVCFPVSAPGQG